MIHDDPQDIKAMVDGYAECAVWVGTDWDHCASPDDHDGPCSRECVEHGNPAPLDERYGTENITVTALDSIRADCQAFATDNAVDLLEWDAGQAGHDFCLTRNGHGTGFWDRGKGAPGERLTEACRPYGESDLYPDDGRLYVR